MSGRDAPGPAPFQLSREDGADASRSERTGALVAHLDRTGRPSALTAREAQVATMVAEGLTNRQIAARLVISERTAENHLRHILTKLGLTTRSQIAAWSVRTGR